MAQCEGRSGPLPAGAQCHPCAGRGREEAPLQEAAVRGGINERKQGECTLSGGGAALPQGLRGGRVYSDEEGVLGSGVSLGGGGGRQG